MQRCLFSCDVSSLISRPCFSWCLSCRLQLPRGAGYHPGLKTCGGRDVSGGALAGQPASKRPSCLLRGSPQPIVGVEGRRGSISAEGQGHARFTPAAPRSIKKSAGEAGGRREYLAGSAPAFSARGGAGSHLAGRVPAGDVPSTDAVMRPQQPRAGGSERRGSRGRPLLFGGVRIWGKLAPEQRAWRACQGLRGSGNHPSSSEPRPAHGRGACAQLAAHPAWLRVGARAASAAPAPRLSPQRLPSPLPLRVLAPVCTDDSVVARPVLTCARSPALLGRSPVWAMC